jgi:Fe-S cluster assembly protein SufD
MSAAVPRRPVVDDPYRLAFEELAARAPEPSWVKENRDRAWRRFEERGFPTAKDEAWRFTSVAPLVRTTFQTAPAGGRPAPDVLAATTFGSAADASQAAFVFVFINGTLVPELSSARLPAGLQITRLTQAVEEGGLEGHLAPDTGEGSAFTSLNDALWEDGAVVQVAAGAVLTTPVHLVFLSTAGETPTMSHPRNLVLLGPRSKLTLVESYGGPEERAYLTNSVTQVSLEEGAVLDHYRLQREGTAAFHVGETRVRQGRSSSYTSHALAFGAALSRHDLRQVFAGEGGECQLNGLFLVTGTQHTDTHTWVDHTQPHCTTRELYKGVLDGQSHGVFVGKIRVGPGAQKTDAQQTNRNLLLSRRALVDSVPQLEILADDVKCKHGSTTGQLDPSALFYLRSRGLDEAEARSLLTYAFASEVVDRIRPAAVKAAVAAHLRQRLPGAPAADPREVA